MGKQRKNKSRQDNKKSNKTENLNLLPKESEISALDVPSTKNILDKIEYFEGIVSKQLDLYIWCEEKVNTLATINAIMLTAATFFVEYTESNVSTQADGVSYIGVHFKLIMILIMVLPIFISLAITLFHVIPKMRSRNFVSPKDNPIHRSVVGIRSFETWQKYKNYLDKLTEDNIYEQIVRQIYGMNKNIWKNQLSIKWAVIFDIFGLFGFIVVIIYNLLR